MKKHYDENTQTLVGEQKRELLDTKTGEYIYVDQITKRVYGTKNFWKCYLIDFLSVLGVFDSRQVDVFIYIVENTNRATNIFLGTYAKIAADIGCSSATIATTMKKLKDNNFIRKVQNGVWLINPNILMRGNDNKRQILLSYYESDEPINRITLSRAKREAIQEKSVIKALSTEEKEEKKEGEE